MKKKLLIGMSIIILVVGMLSGCTDKTADIRSFDRIESDDFILYDVTTYSETEILDLIQSESDLNHKYVDSISPDISISGRSVTLLLFEKQGGK